MIPKRLRKYALVVAVSLLVQVLTAIPVTPAVAAVTATTVNPCDQYVSTLFHGDILPLFPTQITGGEYTEGGKTVTSKCKPSSWNRMIVAGLIWKSLAILNWFAGAVAVIFTILGGVYYLSGYSGENNVKKAKTIIGATYVGFAIVLLARLIVQGTFLLFSDNNKLIDPVASSPTASK